MSPLFNFSRTFSRLCTVFMQFWLAFCLIRALGHCNEPCSFSLSFGSPDQGKWWRDHLWGLRLAVSRFNAMVLFLYLKTGSINSLFSLPFLLHIIWQSVYDPVLSSISCFCIFLQMSHNTYSEIAPAQQERKCAKLPSDSSPPIDNRVHHTDYLIKEEKLLSECAVIGSCLCSHGIQ